MCDSIAFEHLDRSRHRQRSNWRGDIDFGARGEYVTGSIKILLGPRRSRYRTHQVQSDGLDLHRPIDAAKSIVAASESKAWMDPSQNALKTTQNVAKNRPQLKSSTDPNCPHSPRKLSRRSVTAPNLPQLALHSPKLRETYLKCSPNAPKRSKTLRDDRPRGQLFPRDDPSGPPRLQNAPKRSGTTAPRPSVPSWRPKRIATTAKCRPNASKRSKIYVRDRLTHVSDPLIHVSDPLNKLIHVSDLLST